MQRAADIESGRADRWVLVRSSYIRAVWSAYAALLIAIVLYWIVVKFYQYIFGIVKSPEHFHNGVCDEWISNQVQIFFSNQFHHAYSSPTGKIWRSNEGYGTGVSFRCNVEVTLGQAAPSPNLLDLSPLSRSLLVLSSRFWTLCA